MGQAEFTFNPMQALNGYYTENVNFMTSNEKYEFAFNNLPYKTATGHGCCTE